MEETAHVDNFFLFSAPKKLNYLNYFFGHKGRAFSIVRVLETQFLHLLKKLLLFVKKREKREKEGRKEKQKRGDQRRSFVISFLLLPLSTYLSIQANPSYPLCTPATHAASS